MSGSVNKVTLTGRLGRDPEKRFTAGGTETSTLSVATSQFYKDSKTGEKRERVQWHRVVFFGKLAEVCNKWLKTGAQVQLFGSLNYTNWTDKQGIKRYGTDIYGDELIMLAKAGEKPEEEAKATAAAADIPDVESPPEEFEPDAGF